MMDNRPPDMAEKDDFIIDATWNPRNKYLADLQFVNDIMKDAERANIGSSLGCPFPAPNGWPTFAQHQSYLAYATCRIYRDMRRSQFHGRANAIAFGLLTYWDALGWRASDAEVRNAIDNPYFVEIR